MKNLNFLIIALFALCLNLNCHAQSSEEKETMKVSKENKVEVLYFHFNRRCATCNAVERVSKKAVTELYGDKVSFASYNLDETAGEAKGEELGISGQTLVIVTGDNKINITNEAFMNARSNPEKLKATIKENVDSLM